MVASVWCEERGQAWMWFSSRVPGVAESEARARWMGWTSWDRMVKCKVWIEWRRMDRMENEEMRDEEKGRRG